MKYSSETDWFLHKSSLYIVPLSSFVILASLRYNPSQMTDLHAALGQNNRFSHTSFIYKWAGHEMPMLYNKLLTIKSI